MNSIIGVLAIVAVADLPQLHNRLRAWSTAQRGVVGLTLVLAAIVIAGVAERLLDALDISNPTIEIAAGMLLALWAAWQFFSWDTQAVPAAALGGVVPGFFPLLFTPPLGTLLLAAGGNNGLALPLVGAVLVAAALLAPPIALGYRAVRRVTASITVVCGAVLMVEGVLAI